VRRHYYAAISWMDELVGEVLDSLDDHGFTGSTIVIFHSDHGYFSEWCTTTLPRLVLPGFNARMCLDSMRLG
jgi:arylsulfatase A-like enzyme